VIVVVAVGRPRRFSPDKPASCCCWSPNATYDLTFETFDNGKKNMYYNYNQKTKLNALIGQITELVEKLNKDENYELK
jgi:transposase-like protein